MCKHLRRKWRCKLCKLAKTNSGDCITTKTSAPRRRRVTSEVNKSIKLNATTAEGSTVFHIAAEKGHEACVELLLQRGAALVQDSKRRGGRTALHQAAIAGAPKCAELLLEAGEDANVCDTAGATTPLHAAAFAGHASVVEVLLERGVDLCGHQPVSRVLIPRR